MPIWSEFPREPGWHWVRCDGVTRMALVYPARDTRKPPGAVSVYWPDGDVHQWQIDDLPKTTRWAKVGEPE